MGTNLIGRRSRRVKTSPTPLHLVSSFTASEIRDVTFTCQQSSSENHTHHFTPKSCDSALLLRRGNTVVLNIVTSVQLSSRYVVSLTFVPVHRPRDRFGQFRAKGVANGSNDLWLSITLPCNFPIGKYHGHVTLSLDGGTQVLTHFHHRPIVVLFNPWNPDDDSYVASSESIDQNLLSDAGDICRGTADCKTFLKWEYGQYEESVLDVALYLLRSLSAEECRSAVSVSRVVVSQISTRDNSGVMACSFRGSHSGGTHPCRWTGSTVILQKYHRTKTPVRYGQCWVFAGVCVSLLRALGLATRPVTCYNAAHHTSKLGTVDRFFTTEGELLDDLNNDQLWVYHVWVEVWMTRPDLDQGYDGWQVLDATPQDKQSGKFRVGPVSVNGVKKQKVGKKWRYGCEFVLSEVTAETRYLRVGRNKSTSLAHIRKDEVAIDIVTMTTTQTGSSNVLSLIDEYCNSKTPSPVTHSTHFPPPTQDCLFSVSTGKHVILGEPIHICTKISNNGAMLMTVDGRIIGHVIYYCGHVVRRFMSMEFSGVVGPGQSATVTLPIDGKQYMSALVEQCFILFFIAVKVRESKQLFLKAHPFQLVIPHLEIDCPKTLERGDTGRIRIKFKNILKCSLSRVLVLVQAGQLCPQRELSSRRLVLPGGVVSVEFSVRATCCPGNYTLTASLHCDYITDVRGHASIEVTQKSISADNH